MSGQFSSERHWTWLTDVDSSAKFAAAAMSRGAADCIESGSGDDRNPASAASHFVVYSVLGTVSHVVPMQMLLLALKASASGSGLGLLPARRFSPSPGPLFVVSGRHSHPRFMLCVPLLRGVEQSLQRCGLSVARSSHPIVEVNASQLRVGRVVANQCHRCSGPSCIAANRVRSGRRWSRPSAAHVR